MATPARHGRLRRGGRPCSVGRGRPRSVGRRDVVGDLVLELLASHEAPAPLVVRQLRLPLESEDAVAVGKRDGVEGTPETGGEHADRLGSSGHDDPHRAPRRPAFSAPGRRTAAAAAAAGRALPGNSRRSPRGLNLLLRLLQLLRERLLLAVGERLRSPVGLFRGLRQALVGISVLEILHAGELPR